MIATAVTLAFFALVIATLAAMVRRDAGKIAAALGGNSWLAQPGDTVRPVTVRYAPRPIAVTPTRYRPVLSAAA